jgi:hypothetical protein
MSPEDTGQGSELVHKELEEECGRKTEEGINVTCIL